MAVSYKELGLVNTREMFAKAVKGGYAIPAFNFNTMEQMQAIVQAAVKQKSPVIMQVSKGAVSVVTGTLRDQHDHRRLLLHSTLHDSLHLFHGLKVESRDSVATLNSLCKHFPGVHQAEFLVRNCHLIYLLILWRLAPPV